MPPCHPSVLLPRFFSTTSQPGARSSIAQLAHIHRAIPPYPYPPRATYKQSNFGLYGGSHIQFGNKVSEKNEIKTRRCWRPNIQPKRLWSEALGAFVQVKVQARVLRTIDKVGGLDEYLLGGKPSRIKELGMGGWALRWRILQTESVKERFARERERLGVPAGGLQALLEKMKRNEKRTPVLDGRNEEGVEKPAEVKTEGLVENRDGLLLAVPPFEDPRTADHPLS